uniref:Small heat shock protein 21.3 n=1 Tax=Trogoderma granarium TaxID=591392 RepID=A0A8F4K3S7_9COLE|nr:small heat shock protein 21.3 [Trogoderma granarium]
MSLLPYINDAFVRSFFDFPRPSRILNQHFGLELEPEDLISPLTLPQDVRSLLRCPAGYFRPWSTSAAQKDVGSTVNIDKDKFEINLDVQQFAPNEISVKASGDNIITVEGKHEEKQEDRGYVSREFIRRYVLPKGHDIKKVVSNLSSDGVLTITAPRTDTKAMESKQVHIEQTGKPSKAVESKTGKDKK